MYDSIGEDNRYLFTAEDIRRTRHVALCAGAIWGFIAGICIIPIVIAIADILK